MTEQQGGYRIHDWGGDLQWEEFDRRRPGEGEVLVRVEACSIGLTVLNCIAGNLSDDPALLPRVPGHEYVGIVTEVGVGVSPAMVGRRIVAYFYLACGTCSSCLAGDDARCANLAGWVGVHRDGGYAPWAVLPAHNAVVVPDDLDPIAATVVPDAVATPVHVCMSRARIKPGDRVVVLGAGGGVGIHMVQVARLLGGRVAGLDVQDPKLALIEEHDALAVRSDDLSGLDSALWREGPPTVVIDLVGSAETLQWGAASVGMAGRLVILTTFRDRALTVDPRQMVFREFSIIGSRYAGRAEVSLAAELVATGRVKPVIGAVVEAEGVPAVHDALRAGQLLGRGALRWEDT
ncbi:MAG: alcohol dehydrogenase catalytic domain-containing protein [Nitriliruptorales bacterium]|nr:alcohol dehydrogenase catalytic domain-containing protein [Nitriliruptorales bacterium]